MRDASKGRSVSGVRWWLTDQRSGEWDGPFWSVMAGALLWILTSVALAGLFT